MTAIALVACSSAGAEPGASASAAAHAPPGWKQLPAIATAAGAAARADGVVIDAVDAWGEPVLGCYAVWLTLHGEPAGAPALADQILDGFTKAGGPHKAQGARGGVRRRRTPGSPSEEVSLDEVTRPSTPEGMLAFAFARPPYRGRVRAHLGDGRIAAIACFQNQREPAACEAACTRLLQGAP
jgi:hypothetical protein